MASTGGVHLSTPKAGSWSLLLFALHCSLARIQAEALEALFSVLAREPYSFPLPISIQLDLTALSPTFFALKLL